MMRPFLAATAALLATAVPLTAAAPVFDTPAPVAFMKDLSSGAILFQRDPDRQIPPASMAKMMTVLVAFDMIKRGELALSQQIEVRPETWRKWHSQGSTMFLGVGEKPTVADLLHGIIVLSGNDACVVLAEGTAGTEQAFAELMNKKAAEIGLTGSYFANSNGWPDPAMHVTARDLATIAERTIKDYPQLYKQFYSVRDFTWGKTLGAGADITQANRDPLLGRVAGADGLKTGHTDEAGYGFTGSAEQQGRRLVMVIAGLDTYNGRAEQSVSFMNWGFGAWRAVPVAKQGQQLGTAKVQLGDATSVKLVAPKDLAVTIPRGTRPDLKMSIAYKGPLKAPIAKNQYVADLIVRSPDLPPQRIGLVAAEAVGSAGFLDRVVAGFRHLIGA